MGMQGQISSITLWPIEGGEPIDLEPLNFTPVWPAIDSLINALEKAREGAMKLSFTINRLPRRTTLALQQLMGFKKAPRFTYKTKKGYGYAKRNRR